MMVPSLKQLLLFYVKFIGFSVSSNICCKPDHTVFVNAFQAAEYLEQAEYETGNPMEDLKTQSLMKQLLYNPQLQAACPLPFDEAKLWKGQRGPELKQKIQGQFRNIRLCSNPSRLIVDLSYNVDFFLFSNDKTMITKVVFCYQTFIAQNSFLTLYIF